MARKVVRRAIEEAKEEWAMKFVGDINDQQSAEYRRELAPFGCAVSYPALQKGPRVVIEIKPCTCERTKRRAWAAVAIQGRKKERGGGGASQRHFLKPEVFTQQL